MSKLKLRSYQDAPVVLIDQEEPAWGWTDPWGRLHATYPTRDDAYEAYVASMDGWRQADPEALLDMIVAIEDELATMRAALDQTKGWHLIRCLEASLGLTYHVQRNEWQVNDGSDDMLARRDLAQAIVLAVELRLMLADRQRLAASNGAQPGQAAPASASVPSCRPSRAANRNSTQSTAAS